MNGNPTNGAAVRGIWITWEHQRRNAGVSSALGWPLIEVLPHRSRLTRYLLCPMLTVLAILRHRPRVVVAQNPSLVLSALVVLLRRVLGYHCLVDAHNSGLFPAEGRNRWLMSLSRWIQRHADLTIVSNPELVAGVQANGGRSFVLPDSIPEPGEPSPRVYPGERKIAFVCTYSEDEPFEQVFEAAGRLSEKVTVHVTGRHRGRVDEQRLPPNVNLLGFVDDGDYWALLGQADAILVLTLRDSCLVCGAYEGVALEQPLILSDTRALRSWFRRGCVHVEPTAESIAAGIEKALSEGERLRSEMAVLRPELESEWHALLGDLVDGLPR